jgi:uncharacterized protein
MAKIYNEMTLRPFAVDAPAVAWETNRRRSPWVSQLLIQHYLNDLQTLRRVSGMTRESVVSEAFKTLLKDWGKPRMQSFGMSTAIRSIAKNTHPTSIVSSRGYRSMPISGVGQSGVKS